MVFLLLLPPTPSNQTWPFSGQPRELLKQYSSISLIKTDEENSNSPPTFSLLLRIITSLPLKWSLCSFLLLALRLFLNQTPVPSCHTSLTPVTCLHQNLVLADRLLGSELHLSAFEPCLIVQPFLMLTALFLDTWLNFILLLADSVSLSLAGVFQISS